MALTDDYQPKEFHEKVADAADTAAKVSRVAAATTVAGAAIANLTGQTALGRCNGIFVSAPATVPMSPIWAGVAGAADAFSQAESPYSKFKKRK